jgi:hypothetical protein
VIPGCLIRGECELMQSGLHQRSCAS